jgi:hypothetical protein
VEHGAKVLGWEPSKEGVGVHECAASGPGQVLFEKVRHFLMQRRQLFPLKSWWIAEQLKGDAVCGPQGGQRREHDAVTGLR